MKRIILAAAVGVLVSGPVGAAKLTSNNDLLHLCIKYEQRAVGGDIPNPQFYDALTCVSYIRGIMDLEGVRQTANRSPFWCLPSGVSPDQLVRVYIKWAKDNPNQLHHALPIGPVVAFTLAFPCKK